MESNSAIEGGGMYLESMSTLIIDMGYFKNNTAENRGGAIYFGCQDYYSKNLNCKLKITNTSFNSNKGKVLGGAIHWEDLDPILDSSNEFNNNTSNSYGDDISCFPQKLVKMTPLGYMKYQSILALQNLNSTNNTNNISDNTSDNMSNRGRQLTYQIRDDDIDSDITYNINAFQSGGIFDELVFALVDKYNQLVTSDSERYIYIIYIYIYIIICLVKSS